MSEGSCWPEQEAIWKWMKKNNIELSFEVEYELKMAVTDVRILAVEEAIKPNSDTEGSVE